jgi:hypothetical protein
LRAIAAELNLMKVPSASGAQWSGAGGGQRFGETEVMGNYFWILALLVVIWPGSGSR